MAIMSSSQINYEDHTAFFHMKGNIWNLKASKERLNILQRTQAHKRHLLSVLTAKSHIDTRASLSPRHPSTPISLLRKKIIADDNRNLARKIANLHKPANDRPNTSLSLSRNLKAYSSVNRSIRNRTIELQNSKILSRLITASPTIQRHKWAKSNMDIGRYKENLNRGKYRQPDYSQEACKLISREPKFKCLRLGAVESKSRLQKRPRVV